MFSLICVLINGWVNNREAGDLRRHRAHYDVIVMSGGIEHRVIDIDLQGHLALSIQETAFNVALLYWSSSSVAVVILFPTVKMHRKNNNLLIYMYNIRLPLATREAGAHRAGGQI